MPLRRRFSETAVGILKPLDRRADTLARNARQDRRYSETFLNTDYRNYIEDQYSRDFENPNLTPGNLSPERPQTRLPESPEDTPTPRYFAAQRGHPLSGIINGLAGIGDNLALVNELERRRRGDQRSYEVLDKQYVRERIRTRRHSLELRRVLVTRIPFGFDFHRNRVTNVRPGSLAHKAGVRPGWRIVALENQTVSADQWLRIYKGKYPPFTISFLVTEEAESPEPTPRPRVLEPARPVAPVRRERNYSQPRPAWKAEGATARPRRYAVQATQPVKPRVITDQLVQQYSVTTDPPRRTHQPTQEAPRRTYQPTQEAPRRAYQPARTISYPSTPPRAAPTSTTSFTNRFRSESYGRSEIKQAWSRNDPIRLPDYSPDRNVHVPEPSSPITPLASPGRNFVESSYTRRTETTSSSKAPTYSWQTPGGGLGSTPGGYTPGGYTPGGYTPEAAKEPIKSVLDSDFTFRVGTPTVLPKDQGKSLSERAWSSAKTSKTVTSASRDREGNALPTITPITSSFAAKSEYAAAGKPTELKLSDSFKFDTSKSSFSLTPGHLSLDTKSGSSSNLTQLSPLRPSALNISSSPPRSKTPKDLVLRAGKRKNSGMDDTMSDLAAQLEQMKQARQGEVSAKQVCG